MNIQTSGDADARTSAAIKTSDRPKTSVTWRLWLLVEMLAFFVVTPILLYSLLYDQRIPLFALLPPVFVFFIIFLTIDRSFSWRKTLGVGIRLKDLASVALVFAIAGPALAVFAYNDVPERYLSFPRRAYDLWLTIMIVYPLVSVTAQEIMYRVFFFHRYRPLFAGDPQAGIFLNAVLFSFSHIVFQDVTTLIISFMGGLLFAWRYESSRSFWTLCLEHALYGNLIFTLGLGKYFYTGVSNFSIWQVIDRLEAMLAF